MSSPACRTIRRWSDRATEEVIRWATPINWHRRQVTTDTELRGRRLRAGDKLLLSFASANRDELVVRRPVRASGSIAIRTHRSRSDEAARTSASGRISRASRSRWCCDGWRRGSSGFDSTARSSAFGAITSTGSSDCRSRWAEADPSDRPVPRPSARRHRTPPSASRVIDQPCSWTTRWWNEQIRTRLSRSVRPAAAPPHDVMCLGEVPRSAAREPAAAVAVADLADHPGGRFTRHAPEAERRCLAGSSSTVWMRALARRAARRSSRCSAGPPSISPVRSSPVARVDLGVHDHGWRGRDRDRPRWSRTRAATSASARASLGEARVFLAGHRGQPSGPATLQRPGDDRALGRGELGLEAETAALVATTTSDRRAVAFDLDDLLARRPCLEVAAAADRGARRPREPTGPGRSRVRGVANRASSTTLSMPSAPAREGMPTVAATRRGRGRRRSSGCAFQPEMP